jgi:glycosyltransferase involved in cell wall biosynthesis
VRGRFSVVRTGVDPQRFAQADRQGRRAARSAVQDDAGIPAGPLVVCVGRISEAKGQDQLVEAWPLVLARVPDAQLALVGPGGLTATHDGVHPVGARDDIARWYAAADVVAVPSRWDALSLTLLEACGVGSSIVATDVPGVREVLADGDIDDTSGTSDTSDTNGTGRRGAIVTATPTALADAIVLRLRDQTLREREQRLTAEFAARELSQDRAFAEMTRLVDEVLREGPVRPRRGRTTSSSGAGS